MSDRKLKTAILGLGEEGRVLLEAASQLEHFEIQAVADKDTNLAEKVAGEYKCNWYDDYRQLVTTMASYAQDKPGENDVKCLLVAAPAHSCSENIKAAIKNKFNILKLCPPARDFQEAAEFARLAESEKVNFAVGVPDRFAAGFSKLRDAVTQNGQLPCLIVANCSVGPNLVPGWQTDPQLSGGGVLLNDCYQIIDYIIANFGLPQQVYSVCSSRAADRKQRQYLTEDVALVTMKFTDRFFANLSATRTFGPDARSLRLYYTDRTITLTEKGFTVTNPAGKTIKKAAHSQNTEDCYSNMLNAFAMSILEPAENKFPGSIKENLRNMALIDTAYLSARTSMPEEPEEFLQRAHIEPTEPNE